jgi:hypothetical protein
MLRKIFGPKREEVTGYWKKYNKEYNSLYSSLNIVRVTKSRRMRYVGYAWERCEIQYFSYKN